jgi:SHS2 domain-containing protein
MSGRVDRHQGYECRTINVPSHGQVSNDVPCWEHFPHDADIGVRGWGASPSEAFVEAALALTAVVTDPKSVRPDHSVTVECSASSLDLLLYQWLNAIVFEMATRSMLFGQFEASIEGMRLQGVARGEGVDRDRHAPAVEVKGATLTELKVAEVRPGRWMAQCVVDV